MEEKKEQLDLIDYLTCPKCEGVGRLQDGNCQECLGLGLALKADSLLLYWNHKISRPLITQNRISKTTKIIINLILFVMGALGLGAFIWRFWNFFEQTQIWNWYMVKEFFAIKSNLMTVFWVSILTDLYLYFRFNRDLERQEKIKEKKFQLADEKQLAQYIDTWEQFQQFSKEARVEVSSAYSEAAIIAVEKAYLLAKRFKHSQFTTIHLMAALFPYEKIGVIMARLGIKAEVLKEKIIHVLRQSEAGPETIMSADLKKALIEAYYYAYTQKKRKVDVIDLFLALVQIDQKIEDMMYDLEADINKIKNVVLWIGFTEILRAQRERFRQVARYKPKGDIDRAMTALATPALNSYSQNLTRQAKFGYFGPVIGREEETEEIFRIIESGGLRNVMLVGEPGVGKTAIIQELAQKMVAEEVPEVLYDKRMMSLNAAVLVGGTTPDEAQERFLRVLDEIISAGNIILVIENIREFSGITAGGEESVDLLGILAKALQSDSFFCIATSTPADFVQYIEKNEAITSVFQKVEVPEVDQDGAIQILETKAGVIEYKNQVYFSYRSLERAVALASRFIHDRFLPDKAINVIEEAAVLAKKKRGKNTLVNGQDVAEIVSQIANVPATQATEEEKDKLLNLEKRIHQRLIGQEEAVKMVAAALRRARAELRSTKRPIANLMFLGPTGVGKTELAKTIAEVYFGHEKNMIRLDMSEYQGPASIGRLIGSAGVGGFLTEAVRKKPFSLILLDEIEKADANILNIFLQVMEDGRITDNSGRVIDFTNAIIIATSNAGTEFIQEQVRAGLDIKKITQDLIDTQLKSHFRPEFLNRFDGIMVFRPLTMDEVNQIARLMLNKVAGDLESRGVSLQVTNAAVAELAEAGFDPALGARPLRRVIQKQIRDVLANLVLENKLQRRDTVVFDAGGKVNIVKPKT